MSRNPYAKALRVKPQSVVPDKREKIKRDLSALYELEEETPPEWAELLRKLK